MAEDDLAPLTRLETVATDLSLPVLGLVKVQSSTSAAQKTGKPAQAAPRVDFESLYAALKTAIGDHWNTYKDAVSQFALGRRFNIRPENKTDFPHRLPQPRRTQPVNGSLHRDRYQQRTPTQPACMRNMDEHLTRCPRKRRGNMGIGKRQAHKRAEASRRRCCRATTESGGHATSTEGAT